MELRQVEGADEARPGPRRRRARRRDAGDLPGLDHAHPAGLDHEAERALEGVGKGAVELGGLDLELLGDKLQRLDHRDHRRLQPVHRARREGEPAGHPDLDPRQQAGDGPAVRAPPVGRAVVLAVRHPDRRLGVGEEARDQIAGDRPGQDAGDQVPPPVVAVVAVRRALGVDLADRPVAVEHAGVDQVHERQHVAAAVGVAQAARPREALGDARDERVGLGALVGDGDEEVEGDAGGGEPVGHLVPEVMVEDVRHHRKVGRGRRGAAGEPRHRAGEPGTGSGSSLATRSSRCPIST